jgi:ATP-dependent RNA helicase DeaD
MLCRRGGIKKEDIGAIRILDTTTEFEISAGIAERFAAQIRRPDKEDSIRIEALAGAPSREPVRDAAAPKPKHFGKKAEGADRAGFDKKPRYDTKRRDRGEQAHAGKPRHENGTSAKPAFGKKKNKKFRG